MRSLILICLVLALLFGCTQLPKTIDEVKDYCADKYKLTLPEDVESNDQACISELVAYCDSCGKARADADTICGAQPYTGPCYEAQANAEKVCLEGWEKVKGVC